MKQSIYKHKKYLAALALSTALLSGCGDGSSDDTVEETDNSSGETATLSDAFLDFGANVTAVVDGSDIVVESNGRPDHTSPYWDPDNASGLYIEPNSVYTIESQMSPGFIEEYNNMYSLRISGSPAKASSSSSTGLGAIGISVSGAPIFNDQEGPNVNLDIGVISGFDRNGGHTGPETYHYHLEPISISNDDDSLVGVIADGFFLYGRRCYSNPNEYPADLDESGGHSAATKYSAGTSEYHYHIQNDLYLSAYYLLFPGNYQGTASAISN